MRGAKVELQIYPPLLYQSSKQSEKLIVEEVFNEGETLGDLLIRLEKQDPETFRNIYDSSKRHVHLPIVTVINGTAMQYSRAIQRQLADGDKIAWLLMYAGG